MSAFRTVTVPVSRRYRRAQRRLRFRQAVRRAWFSVRSCPRHPVRRYRTTKAMERAMQAALERSLFFGFKP